MKSKLFYSQFLGIVLLLIILLIFIPIYNNKIPKVLKQEVESKFYSRGLDWVNVRVEGRDITLSGVAPNVAMHHQAIKIANSVIGGRVVYDKISPHVTVPYTMYIESTKEELLLRGYMPSKRSLEEFLKEFKNQKRRYKLIDRVDVGAGEPQEWESLMFTIAKLVKELDFGIVNIVNQNVTFSGRVATSKQKREIEKLLNGFKKSNYQITSRIIAMDESIVVCQKRYDELLSSHKIEFKAGEATIEGKNKPLLKSLSEIFALCPNAKLTIIGHTDSKGNDIKNQELSQKRAQAVVAKLFQLGIPLEQMEAIGRGEAEPIASNETQEGRKRNRRIEFKVGGY